jgi:ubiquitin-protein ligase E3 C
MIPTFGNERRRPINLGGASSIQSQDTILKEVKARRLERQDAKQRQEKAIKLQAWWRGIRDARVARKEMCKLFDENVTNIIGLRCLVFIGKDEEILGRWSTTMISYGDCEKYG